MCRGRREAGGRDGDGGAVSSASVQVILLSVNYCYESGSCLAPASGSAFFLQLVGCGEGGADPDPATTNSCKDIVTLAVIH